MAALRSVLVAGSLLTVAAVMAPACGGRDSLLFDDLEGAGGAGQGGFNQGGFNQGGDAPEGGAGGAPFIVGGFGGMPNTMVTSSVTNGSTSVGVSTVGVTTGVTTVGVTTGVTSSGTSGPTSSVATSGVTTVTTVTTGVTSSVTSGNSTSAVTTSGMSSVVTTGGVGGFGGSPTGGGGFTPIDCISCINSNCPQAQACLTNPSCISGVVCTIGTCIQGNNPPNFGCVLGCFNGDFMAAFQALGALTCIGTQCGQECQGAFGP